MVRLTKAKKKEYFQEKEHDLPRTGEFKGTLTDYGSLLGYDQQLCMHISAASCEQLPLISRGRTETMRL